MASNSIADAFVDFRARTTSLDKGLIQTKSKLNTLGASGASAGLALSASFAAAAAVIAAIGATIKGASSAISAYSSSVETASKFNVVFGNETKSARKELTAFADKFGIAQREVEATASGFQDILVPLGMSRKEASKFSISMTKLTGDLASFNNEPTADVARKIKAALTGETEGMKTLGVVLNQAEVKAKSLAMTGKTLESQLTKTEKAQATMALITELSADAQGDLDRTYQSLANQLKAVGGNFDNLKVVIGDAINQIFGVEDGVRSLNSVLVTLKDKIKAALDTKEFKVFAAYVRFYFKDAWIRMKEPFVLLSAYVRDVFSFLATPIKKFYGILGKLNVEMIDMFADLQESLGKSMESVLPETSKALQKIAKERKKNVSDLRRDLLETDKQTKASSKATSSTVVNDEKKKQKAIKDTISIMSGFEAVSSSAQQAMNSSGVANYASTSGTKGATTSGGSNATGSNGTVSNGKNTIFGDMLVALRGIEGGINKMANQPVGIFA